MKKITILIAIPLMLITLTGCTTKAQFVKDVSLDGKGGLVVSYATLRHSDMFFLFIPIGKIAESERIATKTLYIGQNQENVDKSIKDQK